MTRIKSIISALLILAISANASAFVLPVKALALPDKAEDVEIYRKVENDLIFDQNTGLSADMRILFGPLALPAGGAASKKAN